MSITAAPLAALVTGGAAGPAFADQTSPFAPTDPPAQR